MILFLLKQALWLRKLRRLFFMHSHSNSTVNYLLDFGQSSCKTEDLRHNSKKRIYKEGETYEKEEKV